ncbi:MAG: zinc-ribbon domain-containing protein [Clostridiales bacterium]|nr:zinc-ribbon domain-containing protein [Eubacteriales bacterium]MDH7565651.1 zinc-ribbon domain-containing protein [Clostridiales bacterium]
MDTPRFENSKCSYCGEEISAGSRRCPYCGSLLGLKAEEMASDTSGPLC